MITRVSGAFDVKLAPVAMPDDITNVIGRMSLDKKYHGALDATGRGEMTSAMGHVKGSGAYVAVEYVNGMLDGKTGAFVLHHVGVMDRGEQSLVIKVVPDSGTGGLAGISGTMIIRIEGGKHFYDFDYEIATAK